MTLHYDTRRDPTLRQVSAVYYQNIIQFWYSGLNRKEIEHYKPRREPIQSRATVAYDAILEAVTRILAVDNSNWVRLVSRSNI